MLANIQRSIAVFLLLLTAAAGWSAWHAGRPVWLLGVPVAVVALYAGVLALEFGWLSRSYRRSAPERPTRRQLVRAWVAEVSVAPRIFLWRQPFRSRALADHLPPGAQGRRGVVFVHGFFCNRGFWNPWLARLRERGTPFAAVSLEPVFGPIDAYADTIDAAVRRVESATGLPPVLVAHSMGGLACRAWLARRTGGAPPVRVITIGTPHRGTWMARHARATNGIQMRLNSEWLQGLARAEATSTSAVAFTCFWGHCDNIVFPTRSATLPHADNRHIAGTPHIAMAFHPDVIAEVDRLLAA